MAFAFQHSGGVAQQVRVIAASQAEKALDMVRGGEAFDPKVHALRRRCKKLRGLLQLVRPHFDGFSRENSALREAANLLGRARDARVMVETFDALNIDATPARNFLAERADRLANSGDHAAELEQFADILAAFAARVEDWQFDEHGFALVGDGLQKTYGQFVAGLEDAEATGTAEAMHEWRKLGKHHLFHVSLLTAAAPDMLKARAATLNALGDQLGDHHNLAVLGDTLDGAADIGDLSAIMDAIGSRQHQLAAKAFMLGRQLAAEKPVALRARFRAYWRLLPRDQ